LEPSHAHHMPTFRVYRYHDGDPTLQVVVGDAQLPLPEAELVKRARDALTQQTFIAHAVPSDDERAADELCFVPQEGRCEILSIHADARRRHHGDHRRSLMEILNDIAAAVACNRLRFLDERELKEELARSSPRLARIVTDSASLAEARTDVAAVLDHLGFAAERRDETVLCVSEAATNALVHGGGEGTIAAGSIDGRARLVISDTGPGLDFVNWIDAAQTSQASMGYGYRIILDHIDDVCLSTGPAGTTLILDQHPRRPEVPSC
jgi:anti-sigma regulatory factor (Ser/Thr protein kinase)